MFAIIIVFSLIAYCVIFCLIIHLILAMFLYYLLSLCLICLNSKSLHKKETEQFFNLRANSEENICKLNGLLALQSWQSFFGANYVKGSYNEFIDIFMRHYNHCCPISVFFPVFNLSQIIRILVSLFLYLLYLHILKSRIFLNATYNLFFLKASFKLFVIQTL